MLKPLAFGFLFLFFKFVLPLRVGIFCMTSLPAGSFDPQRDVAGEYSLEGPKKLLRWTCSRSRAVLVILELVSDVP